MMSDLLPALMTPVASWILFASLKGIAVIVIVLLTRRLAARWLAPQGIYALWFAVIACLCVPYGMSVEIGARERLEVVSSPPTESHSAPSTQRDPIITYTDIADARISPRPARYWVTSIWLLGMFALAAVVAWNSVRYARMRSRAFPADAAAVALLRECRKIMAVRRDVQLLATPHVESPVVVGFWRPALFLPMTFPALVGTAGLRHVLMHELAHVRRQDVLVNWLITGVQILHWFNPVVWYALQVMRRDMEHACDAAVLRMLSGEERVDYGHTLIRLADAAPRQSLMIQHASVMGATSRLRERINMIAQYRPGGIASSALAVLLLSFTSFIAVTQAASESRAPAPANASAAPGRIPRAQGKASPPLPQPISQSASSPRKQGAPPVSAGAADGDTAKVAAYISIKYAQAKDLASFIQAAPGVGFLSDGGSIAADERSNVLLVHDTQNNIAAIRQLVERLDVPVQQVGVDVVIALVDGDFMQEMIAKVHANPGSSPQTINISGEEYSVRSLLEDGRRANRVEVVSAPQLAVPNRKKVSIEQSAGVGKVQSGMHLRLGVTPTVLPEGAIELSFGMFITSTMGMVPAGPNGALVPAIDTREIASQSILKAGDTVMVIDSRAPKKMSGEAAENDSSQSRQLVAFLTPRILRGVAAAR
jgi:beta-lactamase regulating signal transducer with metallopeptidase domain